MASSDTELVSLIANKLGITCGNSLKKANEFLRLLQLRVTACSGLRQFNDTSRVVMCLDLACNRLGHPFDKSNVLRLAGLNKKQYSNGLNLIENLLDLAKPVNVKTLCVQLGVSEVASFADKVLNMYVGRHSQGPKPLDINLPVYHCVAVFVACKYNKIKVEKPKLIEASRVKRIDFDRLVDDFTPVLETLGSKDVKKSATKRSHKLMDLVSNKEEGNEDDDSKEEKKSANLEAEDFETWKKRLLSKAGEDT